MRAHFKTRNLKLPSALAASLLLAAPPASAFSLSPSGTAIERQQARVNVSWYAGFASDAADWGVRKFREPVHEEIAQLVYGCDLGEACADAEIGYASPYVIAGIRWNDDPPFRLSSTGIAECRTNQTIRVVTQPLCWAKLFKHAEKEARNTYFDGSPGRWNILYRSHFGDLQLLHAMASRDGEPARETQKRILAWAEFAWSVAPGSESALTPLKKVKVAALRSHFPRSEQTVENLFTLGNPGLRRYLHEVAFGSLLHVVTDSFAYGHTERLDPIPASTCPGTPHPQPGVIRAFPAYANQDHALHGGHDSRQALHDRLAVTPNVVEVGKVLVDFYDRRVGWKTLKPYLECVFAIADGDTPAAPGAGLSAGN